jgi:hypothetical protein
VRQRCGFGCVICGLPLFEYEHMEGWANVRQHIAEEITLLCDKHHKERTNGWLPLDEVKKANANPFNLHTGVSKPYDLHFSGQRPEVLIGSNRFITELNESRRSIVPIMVDGQVLVGFFWLDEHLLLQLKFYDEFNRLRFFVFDNQLVYLVETWDIELVGKKLILREAPRNIFLEIEFDPPNRVVISKGRILCNGVNFRITPERLEINNNRINFEGLTFKNTQVAIGLGSFPVEHTCIGIDCISRYPQSLQE